MTWNNRNFTFFVKESQSYLIQRTKQSIILLEKIKIMQEIEERRQQGRRNRGEREETWGIERD